MFSDHIMPRCRQKISTTGRLCKREQMDDSTYCWQHMNTEGSSKQSGGSYSPDKPHIPLPSKGKWTIYGRGSTCPVTRAAVRYIIDIGVPYEFHDTDTMGIAPGAAVSVLREALGGRVKNHNTVPMIFNPKGKFVGGFDNLLSVLRKK